MKSDEGAWIGLDDVGRAQQDGQHVGASGVSVDGGVVSGNGQGGAALLHHMDESACGHRTRSMCTSDLSIVPVYGGRLIWRASLPREKFGAGCQGEFEGSRAQYAGFMDIPHHRVTDIEDLDLGLEDGRCVAVYCQVS